MLKSIYCALIVVVVVSEAAQPHMAEPGLGAPLASQVGLTDRGLLCYNCDEYSHLDNIKKALRALPKTGWLEGRPLYNSLLSYYNGRERWFGYLEPLEKEDFATIVSFEDYCEFSDTPTILHYLAFILPNILEGIEALICLGEVKNLKAYRAESLLRWVQSQVAICTGEVLEDFCQNAEESRILSYQMAMTLYRKYNEDYRAKIKESLPQIEGVLEQAIKNNAAWLAYERSRLEFIHSCVGGDQQVKDQFNFLVSMSNYLCAYVGGPQLPFLDLGACVVPFCNGVKKLSQLGSCLSQWEQETIQSSVAKASKDMCGPHLDSTIQALEGFSGSFTMLIQNFKERRAGQSRSFGR